MLQFSTKPYMQASDQAYVDTVDTYIWRLLEVHWQIVDCHLLQLQ